MGASSGKERTHTGSEIYFGDTWMILRKAARGFERLSGFSRDNLYIVACVQSRVIGG
jgi:hypothetical protein